VRVAGYKWLFIDTSSKHGGLALASGFDGRRWTRGTNQATYAPSPDSLWGINAFHDVHRARWSGRKFGMVMVGVVGFGRVAIFQHGWRAEKAEIVAICIHRRLWRHTEKDERQLLIGKLRAAYDVPVFRSMRQFRRETERWGVPGNALVRHGDVGPEPPAVTS